MAEFKIGLSASDKAQIKSSLKSELITELSTHYQPVVGDGEYVGVRFYDGALLGTLVGQGVNYTPNKFDNVNGYTAGTINGVFPFNAITQVEKNIYFKDTGIQAYDGNGNALKEKFVKIPKFYVRFSRGHDSNGNYVQYDIKQNADDSHGFKPHGAFYDTKTGAYKNYVLLSKYALAKVTDSTNSYLYASVSGLRPEDEIMPQTIDEHRPQDDEHFTLEFSLFIWLHYVAFADRAYGCSGLSSSANVQDFNGCAKDFYGYTVPSADAGAKTFNVINSSVYAQMQVGMKVAVTNNFYVASRISQVTITAKSVGATYTTFTYAEDGIASLQGKLIHMVYKVDNGICDSIEGLFGVKTNYPAGYQPFVEFGLENPYSFKTWIDGMCYYNTDLRIRNLGDITQNIANRATWESTGVVGILGGSVGFLSPTGKYRDPVSGDEGYNGLLVNGICNASTSTGCCAFNSFDSGELCFFWGAQRDQGSNANSRGGVSFVGSTANNAWTGLAYNYSNFGCYGRFYRSSRRENA